MIGFCGNQRKNNGTINKTHSINDFIKENQKKGFNYSLSNDKNPSILKKSNEEDNKNKSVKNNQENKKEMCLIN